MVMGLRSMQTWRRSMPIERVLLAGLLWLCALPLIAMLVLPRLGGLVAALLALAALVAAGVVALALAPAAFSAAPWPAAQDLHEDDTAATRSLHAGGPYSVRMMEPLAGRRQP